MVQLYAKSTQRPKLLLPISAFLTCVFHHSVLKWKPKLKYITKTIVCLKEDKALQNECYFRAETCHGSFVECFRG